MKLKIFAAAASAVIAFTVSAGMAFAEQSCYTEAAEVLDYIYDSQPVLGGDSESNVTRAGFTSALVKALKLQKSGEYTVYTDVPETMEAAGEIYTAQANGWISAGENFYPDRNITLNEAVKITVSALGYGLPAEARGGYPYGYISIADELEIIEHVNLSLQEITVKEAKLIIFNMLNTRLSYSMDNGNIVLNSGEGETTLYRFYKLRRTEGIVNRTPYGSRISTDSVSKDKFIEINGERYDYENADADLLGKNVIAYYLDSENEIVSLISADNEEMSFNLTDFDSITDTGITFYDGNKRINKRISCDCIMIYNGRATDGVDKEKISGDVGNVRILDNDEDGVFDYIFVNSCSYMIIDKIFFDELSLSELNGEKTFTVDLSDNYFILYNAEGVLIETDDLKSGSVLSVAASEDNELVTAVMCTEKQSVTISGLSIPEKKLYTDNGEFNISDYALNNYKHVFSAGVTVDIILGLDNDIVFIESAGMGIKTAYLLKVWTDEMSGDEYASMRVFTQEGKKETLTLRETRLDGEGKKLKGPTLVAFLANHENELIRYSVDSSGYVTNVDLAEVITDVTKGYDGNDKNGLYKVDFGEISFIYRSEHKTCSPYFNTDGTVVFKIPNDVESARDTDFSVGASDFFSNGGTYKTGAESGMEIYNIDETGTAGFIVLNYNSSNPSYTSSDSSYAVEKIVDGVLPDDTVGKILTCYTGSTYSEFYLESDTPVINDKGTGIKAGDIVEMKYNNEKFISSIRVDFDASSEIPAVNQYSGITYQSNSAGYNGYSYGKAYYGKNGYIYLAEMNDAGGSDYSPEKLRNFSIKTKNIVRITRKNGKVTVRPGSYNEIKDYKSFDENNDFIVIRQNYQTPRMVFVYEAWDSTER